jgi:hypothetical protein
MKRIIFLIILFVIIYSESIAQFCIGVQGGASASFISFKVKDYLNGIEDEEFLANHTGSPIIAPIGGFMVNVYYDKRFSFQSEILFENKEPGLSGHQYFIHFPEMIRYNIPVKPKSDKSFFFETGPYFSYCFSKENPYDGNSVGNYTFPPNQTYYISKTDIGIGAGIGYKQQWGIGQIDFCLKFEHSVFGQITTLEQMNLENQEVEQVARLRHKILSLTVSYSLPVKTIKKLMHPVKHTEKN